MQILDAIVLRREPSLSTTTMIRLLCRRQGIVDARAYHLQKSRRRFPSGISVAMWGLASLEYRGQRCTLARFDASAEHAQLGGNPIAFAAAVYLCELAGALLVSGEQDGAAYQAIEQALLALAAGDFPGGWLRWIEVALLDLQGWITRPGLCFSCGRDDADEYDLCNGRWLCPAHRSPGTVTVQREAVAGLAAMHKAWTQTKAPPNEVLQRSYATMAPQVRRAMRHWCWSAIDARVQRPLASRAVLLELGRT